MLGTAGALRHGLDAADSHQVYGPSAWWWEVEELVRKLFLSAVVVLIESGSPMQVRAWGRRRTVQ